MVQRKIEKNAALFFAAFLMLASFATVTDWSVVSLNSESSLLARCTYPLFHASFLHALLNVWCFLSAVFLYEVSWGHIGIGYLIAILAPPFVVSDIPTVGFSAVCFALMGLLLFKVRRRVYYLLCLAPYLIMGFIIPWVNGSVHLYSFVAGAFVSLLNAPLICRRK